MYLLPLKTQNIHEDIMVNSIARFASVSTAVSADLSTIENFVIPAHFIDTMVSQCHADDNADIVSESTPDCKKPLRTKLMRRDMWQKI